jgi:hypothetical protein
MCCKNNKKFFCNFAKINAPGLRERNKKQSKTGAFLARKGKMKGRGKSFDAAWYFLTKQEGFFTIKL